MIRKALWTVEDGTRNTCSKSLKQKSCLAAYNFKIDHLKMKRRFLFKDPVRIAL
jgi:hypothetical protein